MTDLEQARQRVGEVAIGAMDEFQAGGELDRGADTELQAVVVAVAVKHGGQTSIHYKFKDDAGGDLDNAMGQEIIRRIAAAIGA